MILSLSERVAASDKGCRSSGGAQRAVSLPPTGTVTGAPTPRVLALAPATDDGMAAAEASSTILSRLRALSFCEPWRSWDLCSC